MEVAASTHLSTLLCQTDLDQVSSPLYNLSAGFRTTMLHMGMNKWIYGRHACLFTGVRFDRSWNNASLGSAPAETRRESKKEGSQSRPTLPNTTIIHTSLESGRPWAAWYVSNWWVVWSGPPFWSSRRHLATTKATSNSLWSFKLILLDMSTEKSNNYLV